MRTPRRRFCRRRVLAGAGASAGARTLPEFAPHRHIAGMASRKTTTGGRARAPRDGATDGGAAPPARGEAAPKRERPARTARGTSMGGRDASPAERVAGGLNPVAGLEVALEDAESLPQAGVTATVEALSRLIETGRPEFREGTWAPHRPTRPEKSEGGIPL